MYSGNYETRLGESREWCMKLRAVQKRYIASYVTVKKTESLILLFSSCRENSVYKSTINVTV